MDWLYLIGRILFGMLFVGGGLGHLLQLQGMAQYAGAKKVPASKPLVLLSGLIILLGGLSLILGVYMEIGAWLIVFFCVPVAVKMHDFWAVSDPMTKMVEQSQFMKNMALAGAAIVFYWMVQTYGYGPMTLGQPM
jgi:uncharacterized membrane protein YphA (DoxX/SURF4 family)